MSLAFQSNQHMNQYLIKQTGEKQNKNQNKPQNHKTNLYWVQKSVNKELSKYLHT